jgi:hypothetical protein
MKLRDMIDKPEQCMGFHRAIYAGGPGSGRHAKDQAYLQQKREEQHKSWEQMMERHSPTQSEFLKTGKWPSSDTRKENLKKARGFMEAGGPGSGRHATMDTLKPDQQRIANKLHKAGLASELRDYFSNVVPGGFNGERLYDHMDKKFGVGKWNNKEGADHIMKITSTPGGLKRFSSFKGY